MKQHTAISNTDDAAHKMQQFSDICHAVSDMLRVNILRIMHAESFGVTELCGIFDVPQPCMSHHLKVLLNASLVATRREGNYIFYRRVTLFQDDSFGCFRRYLFEVIDGISISREIKCRIKAIYQKRAKSSQEFFAKNAHKFYKKQALIVTYSNYADLIDDILTNMKVPRDAVAMEIGPGNGTLLRQLAPHFSRIYAFDNSHEMLEKAQDYVHQSGYKNVIFHYGDTKAAVKKAIKVDFLVVNMVLHHIASPLNFFKDLQQLLHREGQLLLIELCPHNQDWARKICGDIWLGFKSEDLNEWAMSVGLREKHGLFLGMKNGFQVQIKLLQHDSS